MPFSPSVVNGFVQISADETMALGYVSMAQDSISFGMANTAQSQEKYQYAQDQHHTERNGAGIA
ncbi:hypothetical protein VRB95_18110 [Erwinia aphidicola]|jgi:hypothetical protein|uniref:Uncharacterized protein n=1 Tax=Erwinia aphidicola TaxID=68334 RepID=A0ABU8DBZ1_ERWAP|nr:MULTISPECIES: hypothetical protein [Erwinia]MBN1084656.1 hypothetical protein [Erwinia aphidicola]MCP2231972.1 hypothetical protein [Erwinia aphidicola]MDI3439968.1 hypothetical protein [Erwinia sp. V90_4]PIJ58901.1 hypothetical protein BOM23_07570 [Erwinia sp. OLMDLW33]